MCNIYDLVFVFIDGVTYFYLIRKKTAKKRY
jgi:hypothetical protein